MEKSKTITVNRKAYHDYHIMDTMEAGIVLKGTEIKSIRDNRVNIRDAYARADKGEMWLHNCHISKYQAGGHYDHDPDRPRKLLLHKYQINNLVAETVRKGLTIVPLKLYIKDGKAKVELGLAKGKRMFDKRDTIAKRETDRIIERSLKRRV